MLQSFLLPAITIFLAEFADKSQLSLLLLSSRTRHHIQLFIGAILGFILVDGIAILTGSFVKQMVPAPLLTIFSSALFLFFGLSSFRTTSEKKEKTVSSKNAFFMGFLAITLTEFGDKTQLAAGAFATEFDPILVFFGVIVALGILSALTISVGAILLKKINQQLLTKISGVLFILIGIAILFI